MKYKKYPSYKDSGVEWLGDIPEHWNQRKIKHFAQTIPGGTPSTTEPEYWDGDIPWLPSGAVQNCIINEDRVIKFITKKGLYSSATKYIKPNSTLIALTGATCSNIGYLTFKSTANQSVVGIVTQKSTSDKYVFYSLISQKSQILVKRNGGAQAGINEQDVKDIFISYPPIHEQEQIADFLDKATAKIDTLIEKQTKQIELLKEKRQAVISHAVTKGINPNVPMKDSGVEWLGKIPEHWEVKKLKFVVQLLNKKEKISNQIVVALENIESWSGKYIESDSNYQGDDVAFCVNDILFGKLRPYLAKVFLCSFDGIAFGDLLTYRPNKNYLSKYVFYSLISEEFIKIVDSSTYGAKMPRASSEFLNEMRLTVPPLDEQQQIANYLDEKTSKIDILIEKSNKSIELLKEKRTAIISACITGKIDVREEK